MSAAEVLKVCPREERPAVYGAAVAAVRDLLAWVGEDITREGLANTPERVARALAEMTTGYDTDPAEVLATTFDEPYDEMVVVTGVRFASLCEHHMLPFTGVATVGYVPGKRVVGLSKLARLVDVFARRLQVQERMTQQIAQAITENLEPLGVGVVLRAHHMCMGIRGVTKDGASMTTSSLHGVMREKGETRAEFLELSRANGGRP